MKAGSKVIAVSIALGLFVWFLDALLDYLVFHEGTFLGLSIYDVPAHELYDRSAIVIAFVVFGLIISRIIGRRQQAEKKLAASEANYRAIFDAANDAIFVHDVHSGEIVDINRKMCEMYGYTREEACKLDVEAISSGKPPYTQEDALRWIRKAVQGEPQLFEWMAKDKDGRPFWVDVNLKRASIAAQDHLLAMVRDITERKQAEENLRQESLMRNTLLDNLPCIAMILKKGTREIVASNWAARTVGAVPGKTCYETVADRDDKCPFCLAPEVWATDEPRRVEVEYRGTNYEGIWVPLTEDLYVHYIFDITERKQAEEELRRYESMITSSKDMIALLNRDFTYLAANDAYARAWGKSKDEVIEHTVAEVLGKETFESVVKPHAERCLAGEEVHFNDWFNFPVYGQRYMDVSYFPYIGEGEAITGFVVYGRNITEHKQAEDERDKLLQKTEEQVGELTCLYGLARSIRQQKTLEDVFRDAVALIPQGWRYPGITCGKVIFEGKEFAAEPFGNTEWKQTSDIIIDGKRCGSVEVYYLQQRPEQDEGPFVKEERHLIDGIAQVLGDYAKRRWAEDELQKAHDELEGRVERRTTELRVANAELQEEIANRKRVEERERQLAKDLTHMDRVKTMGEMAGGIAHELNQPLAVIVTRAETVALGLQSGKEPSKEKLLEHLKWIADQGHRAGEIIRHMRQFVRYVEPNRTTVQMNEGINEVVPLVENELRLGQIALTINAAPSLPPVLADKIQLQQVLLNLMRNGIEAMEQTQPDERELSVQATPRDGLIEVAVCDTGHGISEDEIDRLFGTFYSTKAGGMGMGLAISRSIIETHGGTIWAKSNVDGGATFTFTLPLAGEGNET